MFRRNGHRRGHRRDPSAGAPSAAPPSEQREGSRRAGGYWRPWAAPARAGVSAKDPSDPKCRRHYSPNPTTLRASGFRRLMPVHMWPTSHRPADTVVGTRLVWEPTIPVGGTCFHGPSCSYPAPGLTLWPPTHPQCLPGTGLSTAQALTNTHTSDGQAPPSGIPVQ